MTMRIGRPYGVSDGREGVVFGLSFEPKGTPRIGRVVDQAPVAAAVDYDSTLVGTLELSSKKWVFAVQCPGSRKHTKQVVEPNGPALATLLETMKARGAAAGKPVARVVVTHDAGRDGFWLVHFLKRRGIEVHVMQASSLPVDRRARRAMTDAIDAEMLLRTLLAWLRGEPRFCSMVPMPSEADEEARRAHREREDLIGERRSLLNRIDGILATLGSRKGDCWDNAVTETLFGSLKVERLHGRRFVTRRQAKDEAIDWLRFYNRASEHPSLYVIEGKRFCWPWSGPAGYLALRRARSTIAASVASAVRENIQGPSGKGRGASISPTSAASRRVLDATFSRRAASERLSQGSTPSSAALNTGIRWCERSEVTRSRVQRLPWPVLRSLRLRSPAIRSSLAISTSSRTAAMMSAGVLLRCPRRRLGKRSSL